MRFLAILVVPIAPLFVSTPSVAQNALWDVLSYLSCSKETVISCDTSRAPVEPDVDLALIVEFFKIDTTRIGENETIIESPLIEEKIGGRFNKFSSMSISFGKQAKSLLSAPIDREG